jgi:hypothetical protein
VDGIQWAPIPNRKASKNLLRERQLCLTEHQMRGCGCNCVPVHEGFHRLNNDGTIHGNAGPPKENTTREALRRMLFGCKLNGSNPRCKESVKI